MFPGHSGGMWATGGMPWACPDKPLAGLGNSISNRCRAGLGTIVPEGASPPVDPRVVLPAAASVVGCVVGRTSPADLSLQVPLSRVPRAVLVRRGEGLHLPLPPRVQPLVSREVLGGHVHPLHTGNPGAVAWTQPTVPSRSRGPAGSLLSRKSSTVLALTFPFNLMPFGV